MTPTELLAAAELYATVQDDLSPLWDSANLPEIVRAMSEHILATVAADDDEGVTVEWLSSIGGQDHGLYISFLIDFPSPIDLRFSQADDDADGWEASLWQGNADDPNGHDDCVAIPNKKTRGQVRSLLRALGAERKETT